MLIRQSYLYFHSQYRLLSVQTCKFSRQPTLIRASLKAIDDEREKKVTRKSLTVAILGEPNVGKSTLINKLVGYHISGVSNKINTTTANTMGVITEGNTQIEFVDSPGIISRKKASKYKLDLPMCLQPSAASSEADLLTVLYDASTASEFRSRLSQETIEILDKFPDKKKILLLNKIDLVKDKRLLLNIATRLTLGHMDGKPTIQDIDLMTADERRALNLIDVEKEYEEYKKRPLHSSVIELDPVDFTELKPRPKGHKGFSNLFLVSSLLGDGVEDYKNCLFEYAREVEHWKHEHNIVTRRKYKDIIHEIIRGKFMDYANNNTPYNIKYNYKECYFDDFESLRITLLVVTPDEYNTTNLIGPKGLKLTNIINETREILANTFGCDVILKIAVKAK